MKAVIYGSDDVTVMMAVLRRNNIKAHRHAEIKPGDNIGRREMLLLAGK